MSHAEAVDRASSGLLEVLAEQIIKETQLPDLWLSYDIDGLPVDVCIPYEHPVLLDIHNSMTRSGAKLEKMWLT